MASAEQQTKDALLASSGLVALVGDAIYPDEVPEDFEFTTGTPAAVAYERGDSAPNYVLDGELHSTRVSMNVTVWAKTRSKANEVALAVTDAMQAQQNWQTAAGSAYEPELEEYAAIRTFDVWELD
jgi:hypothetical protein